MRGRKMDLVSEKMTRMSTVKKHDTELQRVNDSVFLVQESDRVR
jgi:hypothetical protein